MSTDRARKQFDDSKLQKNKQSRPTEYIVATQLNKVLDERNIKACDLAIQTDLVESKVSDFRSAARLMYIEDLMKLSQALDVTPDFLLGFTDQKKYNPDARIAAEYTGLSEKSVMTLKSIVNASNENETYRDYLQIMDDILQSGLIADLLVQLNVYLKTAADTETKIAATNDKLEAAGIEGKQAQNRFYLADSILKLADQLMTYRKAKEE